MSVEEPQGFVGSLDSFSRDLYQQLINRNPEQNLICSPLSIQTCAAMLRMGADDESETANQLNTGLRFGSADIIQMAEGFLGALKTFRLYKVVNMANKLYVMKGYRLSQDFTDVLTIKFLSTPEVIDFTNVQSAAATINQWVESKTNNLIKNVVSPSTLTAETRLVLVNAIHFKGEWTVKFDEKQTKPENFTMSNKTNIKVAMMNNTSKYMYANVEKLNAKGLSMAYNDSKLRMLIILPNEVDGIQGLASNLGTTTLKSVISELNSCEVSVKLPKFKAEFEAELSPIFKALGMEKIFENPELGKMLQEDESLAVSKILHKAYIEVNEEGTEAAAATAAVVTLRSVPSKPPKIENFHVHHPFLFVIYDQDYGCLFVGTINSPEALDIDVKPNACPGCETECPKPDPIPPKEKKEKP